MKYNPKRGLLCFALILSFLFPCLATSAYAQSITTNGIKLGSITANGVYVREQPDNASKRLVKLDKGDECVILGRGSGYDGNVWYEVRVAQSGKSYEGYLNTAYVQEFAESDESEYDQTVYIGRRGAKYHYDNSCSNITNPTAYDMLDALLEGFTPCDKCASSSWSPSSVVASAPAPTKKPSSNSSGSSSKPQATKAPVQEQPRQSAMVWLSATGSKYHSIPDCGNMNPNKATQVSLETAKARGKTACSNCNPPR